MVVPPLGPTCIIGLAAIMPKAADLATFWGRILAGADCTETVPLDRWDRRLYFDADPDAPDRTYADRGGFLPDVPFDPLAFGLPPTTVQQLDSAQLVALKVAQAALEDAGYPARNGRDHRRTAVVLGVAGTTMKALLALSARLELRHVERLLAAEGLGRERIDQLMAAALSAYPSWQEDSFPGFLANVVAARIAARFDLGGLALAVDAACASALAAVAVAKGELELGRADLCLTGGLDTDNSITAFLSFSKTPAMSPTGCIRPLDQAADGTLVSEGVGMLVLKRLADAERDGDRIYAVLKGVGTASDGRSKSIYAPRREGQVRALERAYEEAGVSPASIGLVDAHATGTPVGDEVEIAALTNVFRASGAEPRSVVLGSVKALIGHTKAAAGAAGLIKTALALHHRVLPPTPEVETPIAPLATPDSPFDLPTAALPWVAPTEGQPRRAAVSAFGFGGTNTHAIVEEWTPSRADPAPLAASPRGLLLDAANADALAALVRARADALKGPDRASVFTDWAKESASARPSGQRAALGILARDVEEAAAALALAAARLPARGEEAWSLPVGVHYSPTACPPGPAVAVFPGQGSQFVGMGSAAIAFPQIRHLIEAMDERFRAHGRRPLSSVMLPSRAWSDTASARHAEALRHTLYAQAAIGVVSLGLYQVLSSAGFNPVGALGHSFGELTALVAAGALDQETFLGLVQARGEALDLPPLAEGDRGGLLAVHAEQPTIEALISGQNLAIANDNAPDQVVLGGPSSALDAAEEQLHAAGITAVRLPVAAAFHTQLVEAARGSWCSALAAAEIKAPTIPVFANAKGEPYAPDPERVRAGLAEQPFRPVLFRAAVEAAWQAGGRVFVEIGPKAVLSRLISRILAGRPHLTVALNPATSGDGERQVRDAALKLRVHGLALAELEPLAPPPAALVWTPSSLPISGAPVGAKARRQAFEQAIARLEAERRFTTTSSPPTPAPETPLVATSTPPVDDTAPASIAPASPAVAPGPSMADLLRLEQAVIDAHETFLALVGEQARAVADLTKSGSPEAAAELTQQSAAVIRLHERWLAESSSRRTAWVARERPASPTDARAIATESPPRQVPATAGSTRPEPQTVAAPQSRAPAALDVAELVDLLLEVVAETTGYPAGFLNADLDLEADLGVDSIKRVEIIAGLRARLVDRLGQALAEPEALPRQELVRARTLAEIAKLMARHLGAVTDGEPESPPAAPVSHDAGSLLRLLAEVVAEKTGYPPEMLEPCLDIEADLGIDSIKRVEILSTLRDRLGGLDDTAWPDRRQLAVARTLDDMVELFLQIAPGWPGATPVARVARDEPPPSELKVLNPVGALPQPLEPVAVELPPARGELTLPAGVVVILAAPEPLATALAKAIERRGDTPIVLSLPGKGRLPDEIHQLALQGLTPEVLARAFKRVARAFGPPVAAVALMPSGEHRGLGDPVRREGLASILSLLAAVAPADEGGAGVADILLLTQLDGAFGLEGPVIAPEAAGVGALARVAAREWPAVRVTALDLHPALPPEEAAAAAICEWSSSGPLLRGTDGRCRRGIEVAAAPLRKSRSRRISATDVVLVTGGARGITAECALALAAISNARFILVGRTPVDPIEPDWALGVADGALQAAAASALGPSAGLRQIRLSVGRIRASRMVAATLARFDAAGVAAYYVATDLTDRDRLAAALRPIFAEVGTPSVLVHGAGALADRRIADKRADDFDQVYGPKVDGLVNLLEILGDSSLHRVILFASTAGTFGNPGQADYAEANAVLEGTARWLTQERGIAATAIAWGPWESGMVTPGLAKQFAKRGIQLIEPRAGAALFAELAMTATAPVIVVGGDPAPDSSGLRTSSSHELRLAVERRFSIEEEPALADHVIDGRPVLPAAWAAAWIAATESQRTGGPVALQDFSIGQGAPFANGTDLSLRLTLAPSKDGRVKATVTTAADAPAFWAMIGKQTAPPETPIHLPQGPAESTTEYLLGPIAYGPSFRVVRRAWRPAENQLAIEARGLPPVPVWASPPIDPGLYDVATHALLIWLFARDRSACLPTATEQVVWNTQRPADGAIRALVTVQHVSTENVSADIVAVDPMGRRLLTISGMKAMILRSHDPVTRRLIASATA